VRIGAEGTVQRTIVSGRPDGRYGRPRQKEGSAANADEAFEKAFHFQGFCGDVGRTVSNIAVAVLMFASLCVSNWIAWVRKGDPQLNPPAKGLIHQAAPKTTR